MHLFCTPLSLFQALNSKCPRVKLIQSSYTTVFLFQVIGPAVFSLDLLETVRDPGCGVCALLFCFCGGFGFFLVG